MRMTSEHAGMHAFGNTLTLPSVGGLFKIQVDSEEKKTSTQSFFPEASQYPHKATFLSAGVVLGNLHPLVGLGTQSGP